LDEFTTEETIEFNAIEALPHLTKAATSRGPSKASRPPAAKNAGSNYTGNKSELGKRGKQPTSAIDSTQDRRGA